MNLPKKVRQYQQSQQQHQQQQQVNKINNSYESEPSSGSGSSLSENNDCNASDDENMRLPYTSNSQDLVAASALNNVSVVHSSQESPFRGFGDSPFNKIDQIMSSSIKNKLLNTNESFAFTDFAASPVVGGNNSAELEHKENRNDISVACGKLTFPRFYDLLLENSCNAVDMKLPGVVGHVENVNANAENTTENHAHVPQELTFNGKINKLTDTLEKKVDQNITNDSKVQSDMVSASRKYSNVESPDLFGDENDDSDEDDDDSTNANSIDEFDIETIKPVEMVTKVKSNILENVNKILPKPYQKNSPTKLLKMEKMLHKNRQCERELLRRTRKCLSGVPPPPSMTIPQVSMFDEIVKRKTEILDFFLEITTCKQNSNEDSNDSNTSSRQSISLLKPTHTVEQTKATAWKDILAVRQQGLCYNLCKASEENDYLQLAVIDRFIGAETASSYRVAPSSEKKRQSRLKLLTQSPGSRLSHLAKRRSVFSSANLANVTNNKCFGPQIRIDRPKIVGRRRGTPKRATPNSKKKRKTPTSSARKRLNRCDLKKPGPTRETSKRALFQSPAKQLSAPISRTLQIKPEIATRVEKSKRALFSPDKSQCSQISSDLNDLSNLMKRKRATDDDSNSMSQSGKLFRGSQEIITPRSLKIKSQSFCIGANSTSTSKGTSTSTSGQSNAMDGSFNSSMKTRELQRAQSDMAMQSNSSLTENQRKKLLWAVSQALQEKKIAAKHENFREYASVLARVVRRIFQEYYQKTSTSNSETLLRLSKKYVYYVLGGGNADDIYLQAKSNLEESARIARLRFSGYIGPQEYEERKLAAEKSTALPKNNSMQNLFMPDNSMDSCGMSWTNSSQLNINQKLVADNTSTAVMTADVPTASKDAIYSENIANEHESETEDVAKQQPIQSNSTLQNSSSKNNLSLVLRENILDAGDQRRSAQKNLNKSPFVGRSAANTMPNNAVVNNLFGSGCKMPTQMLNNINCARAKRNISFDS